MYTQVEKPKENKSRAITNSVAQKKSDVKKGFGFVDNRPELIERSIIQRQIAIGKNKYSPSDTLSEVVFRNRMFEDSMNPRMIEVIKAILKIYDTKSLSFQDVGDFSSQLSIDVSRINVGNVKDIGLPNYDVEDTLDHDEHSDIDSDEMGVNDEALEKAISTKHVFGLSIGDYNPAIAPIMYRSVENAELLGVINSILETGHPDFSHKKSSKGRAEKFFAPNKAYVVESMGGKGKRSTLLEIVFDSSVYELVNNPDATGLDINAEGALGFEHLSVEKKHDPKPIKIKSESPKGKKGISYTSYNVGFRKEKGLLKEFSSKVIGINIVDHEYDIKTVKKRF